MNMQEISLDRLAETFGDLINVKSIDLGYGIAHRGEHPNEGETFIIQCGEHALMISEGVGLL